MRMNASGPAGSGDSPAAGGLGAHASTAARQPNAITDDTIAPLVDTAPFGRPVVPDV